MLHLQRESILDICIYTRYYTLHMGTYYFNVKSFMGLVFLYGVVNYRLLISIKYPFVFSFLSLVCVFFLFLFSLSFSLSSPFLSIFVYLCLFLSVSLSSIILNWRVNVLNPSYLRLQGPSACAIERLGASETPACRTNVSIPFRSHCIPVPPFRSVLMFQYDRNLLR